MLKTLYHTRPGGYVLKLITRPGFSPHLCGHIGFPVFPDVYQALYSQKRH